MIKLFILIQTVYVIFIQEPIELIFLLRYVLNILILSCTGLTAVTSIIIFFIFETSAFRWHQIFAFAHLIAFNFAVERPIMFKDEFMLDAMLSVILCNKHWPSKKMFYFCISEYNSFWMQLYLFFPVK